MNVITINYSGEKDEYWVSYNDVVSVGHNCASLKYVVCFSTIPLTIAIPKELNLNMIWEEYRVNYVVKGYKKVIDYFGKKYGDVYIIKASRHHYRPVHKGAAQDYHVLYSKESGILAFQDPRRGATSPFYIKNEHGIK